MRDGFIKAAAVTPKIKVADVDHNTEQVLALYREAVQGGAKIIELRGRSSFQSPAYCAVKMIEASMGGKRFNWPAGTYVNNEKFQNVMMAMPTVIDATGVHFTNPKGTAKEMADLQASYEHLCKMRDEIVTLGIIPAVKDWKKVNKNL